MMPWVLFTVMFLHSNKHLIRMSKSELPQYLVYLLSKEVSVSAKNMLFASCVWSEVISLVSSNSKNVHTPNSS